MPNYLSGRFQPEADYAFSYDHTLSHVMLLSVLNSDSLLNIIAKYNMNAIILNIIAKCNVSAIICNNTLSTFNHIAGNALLFISLKYILYWYMF